uniref:Uncharacterized protein n=1 Tax=Tetranychus urticae TaxID=32264 RepID=T1KUZ9_TETUR
MPSDERMQLLTGGQRQAAFILSPLNYVKSTGPLCVKWQLLKPLVCLDFLPKPIFQYKRCDLCEIFYSIV